MAIHRMNLPQLKLKDIVDFVAATLAANGARAVLPASVAEALAPVEHVLAAELHAAAQLPAPVDEGVGFKHHSHVNARLSALTEPRLGAVTTEVI